jgi:hypothetical protein
MANSSYDYYRFIGSIKTFFEETQCMIDKDVAPNTDYGVDAILQSVDEDKMRYHILD